MNIIGQNGNNGDHYQLTGSVPDGKEFNVEYDIEVKSEEVKGDSDFLTKIDEIKSRMVKDNIIEKQSQKITSLENKLELTNEEINKLDRAAIKMVDSLKDVYDYLKVHGTHYDKENINWSDLIRGFAKERDYIEQRRKPRSKPKGKTDPYLDKNKDPDYPFYPNKDKDNIITY